MGTDVNGRAAALVSGRAEATLLTAPAYFKLEEQGFKTLANLADHRGYFRLDGVLDEEERDCGRSQRCPKS